LVRSGSAFAAARARGALRISADRVVARPTGSRKGARMRDPEPLTVRMRRICIELSRLRKESNLSGADIERLLGIPPSTLSRIESGQRAVKRDDLSALLVIYRVPRPFREALLKLHSEANQPSLLDDLDLQVHDALETWIGFEEDAAYIRNYEYLLVPGLVQIHDYARAAITGGALSLERQEVDRRVAARMARQRLLQRSDGPKVSLLVHEAALRQGVGGREVMREQLYHLEAMAERVELRVVPDGVGAHPGLAGGAFVILDFPGLPSLVHVEHQVRSLYLEDRAVNDGYRVAFNSILAVAYGVRESVELIRRVGEELR
jgi:transcriptional regulator with XRE-family HTH domain